MAQALRFAFDVGTNSIGWAVLAGHDRKGPKQADQGADFELEEIIAAGSRIFSDGRNPKDGSSLAEMRSGPRGARRRRDRLLARKRKVTALLRCFGLLPLEPIGRTVRGAPSPYSLRARGLDAALTPEEFGRVLLHLNQRRGFKSNRKTDGADKNKGPLKEAMKRLEESLDSSGARTLGEFLAQREHEGARFRPNGDPKLLFDFYPTRALVEAEFDTLWAKQSAYHPNLLTENARIALRQSIFHQRPLKPIKPGKCTFNPEEERAPKALPSVEAREFYQTVNELRYGVGVRRDTPLTLQQRDLLATKLLDGGDWTFDQIRSGLKLGSDVRFSHEDALDKIKGSVSANLLRKKEAFGKAWSMFDLAKRDEIVLLTLEEENNEALIATLVLNYGLDGKAARAIADTHLPGGYGRLGKTANTSILERLKNQIVTENKVERAATYSEACQAAGYHHSDFRDGVIHDRLPHYQIILDRHTSFGTGDPDDPLEQRLGRVANPTVHIGLNQIRKLTNALVETYGRPTEIVVELARDLPLSSKQRKELEKEQRKNEKENERRIERLRELGHLPTQRNMVLLRLWEDQTVDGVVKCPYTLQTLNLEALFSGDLEIDHILPMSESLDDSNSNKVLCTREANRAKRNRTPYRAFSSLNTPPIAAWADIEQNAAQLKRSKSWRFSPNAMERFLRDHPNFLARQLNETRYLARLAKDYLSALTSDVWVVTGTLTSLLRGKWGLNSILDPVRKKLDEEEMGFDDILSERERRREKNRNDHRHHAIDAIVIGCTSRRLLQDVARRAGQAKEENLNRLFGNFPEPMPDFHAQVRAKIGAVIVSHKADHGKGGALHADTSYGLVGNEDERDNGELVYRVALSDLEPSQAPRIRDSRIRSSACAIADRIGELEGISPNDPRRKKKKWSNAEKSAFAAELKNWVDAENDKTNRSIAASADAKGQLFQPRLPIRHIRIQKPKKKGAPLEIIRHGPQNEHYRALIPDSNWCIDVVQMRDGKWIGFGATRFEVNKKGWRPVWEVQRLGGKLVMRLHNNDLVELNDDNGQKVIKRVVRLEPSANRVRLVPHYEGGKLEDRHKDLGDPFEWDFASFTRMKERNSRKVEINEIGLVKPAPSNVS